MNELLVIGAIASLVLLFIALWAGLRFLERVVPGFTEFLDKHVGPEPEPWRDWS